MLKQQLEKVIAELETSLEISSGVMMGLDMLLDDDWENEKLHYDSKKASDNHRQMFNALIILKNTLKGME